MVLYIKDSPNQFSSTPRSEREAFYYRGFSLAAKSSMKKEKAQLQTLVRGSQLFSPPYKFISELFRNFAGKPGQSSFRAKPPSPITGYLRGRKIARAFPRS